MVELDKRARILVVDDDPTFTEMVAEALATEDFAVRRCGCGDEALALVQAEPPDLILLDIHLPGPGVPEALDGLRVAEHLAGDRRTRDIPVLLITGVAPQEQGPWSSLLSRRGQRVLFKPFGLKELLGAIESVLSGQD
jgi:CheY-like chemotaxis protein